MNKLVLFILLFFLLLAATVFYIGSPREETQAQQESPVYKFRSVDLFNSYAENPVLGDSLYKNQWIEVEGEVNELDWDFQGARILVLKENDDLLGVACTMDTTGHTGRLEYIRLRDYVRIRGICAGFDSEVRLTRCTLLRVGEGARTYTGYLPSSSKNNSYRASASRSLPRHPLFNMNSIVY